MENIKRQQVLGFTGGVLFVILINNFWRWKKKQNVLKKIKSKSVECKRAFDYVVEQLKKGNLSEDEVSQIVQLSFNDLHQQLQDGTLKAVTVLQAYQAFALKANERLNAITEPLVTAMDIAEKLDKQTGKKGLLHGIPVSVKESFDIKSLDTTAGISHFIGKPRPDDAALIKVLKDEGAIPFVRTNIPQTMMIYECSNPIYKETLNPYDLTKTPGGSTGGESALLGAKASIIGYGSDIGGSIRVPSHFCGCYGLKTTLERLSRKGTLSLSKGQMQVSGTVGPMARDLDGLIMAFKVLLTDLHFELDPSIPPIKFRDEIYNSKQSLKIGYYVTDGYTPAVPSCRRAVMLTKKALEAMGHTVVEFKPPRMVYAYTKLYLGTVMGDKGKNYTSKLKGDIIDPTIWKLMLPSKLPNFILRMMSWLYPILTKDKVFGDILKARMGINSVHDWFNHALKIQAYKEEFLSAWRREDLDAVICPPFAMAAPPLGKVADVISAGNYSMIYNLLNYPGGVLPVTKVTADDVNDLDNYPTNTRTLKLVKQFSMKSEGLPVGVQCVCLPFNEELVLRLMREAENGLNKLQD
ncbi:hypothetical protein ACF0H5_018490 [Mactra antiquata]